MQTKYQIGDIIKYKWSENLYLIVEIEPSNPENVNGTYHMHNLCTDTMYKEPSDFVDSLYGVSRVA